MLEKLNTLLDSGAPRIRRAWRQWTGASHQVNVDNAKYQVQSVLILRAAFAQSALRLQMQAFRRWSGTSAAAAAAFETATRLNRQDWELSTRRTLLRLAETWSRDGMLWAIRVWHRHIMDEKLAEQVREQRFLAVEKLETFAAKTQQRNLRSAWRSWRQLLQGAKGDEAARKLKNRFKRIKRDLRRAARGQGLGILDAVSSRLAYEAKGYAFRCVASDHGLALLDSFEYFCEYLQAVVLLLLMIGVVWILAIGLHCLWLPRAEIVNSECCGRCRQFLLCTIGWQGHRLVCVERGWLGCTPQLPAVKRPCRKNSPIRAVKLLQRTMLAAEKLA